MASFRAHTSPQLRNSGALCQSLIGGIELQNRSSKGPMDEASVGLKKLPVKRISATLGDQ
jgi:hypothetical protein